MIIKYLFFQKEYFIFSSFLINNWAKITVFQSSFFFIMQHIRDILASKSTRLFLVLSGFFIANALIAEFMGVKIFSLERTWGAEPVGWNILGGKWNFDLSAGVLLWPVVFIMTDIINEYFGRHGVRFLSFLVAGLIAYGFFMFYWGIKLAPADWWPASQTVKGVADMNTAFTGIFGQSLGIIIGSLSAFILGQILDVWVFQLIKKRTNGRYLWLRATGSTLLSQLVDTFVVTFTAFYFYPILTGEGQAWQMQQLLTVCMGGYLYKFIVAVLMTPVVYLVHNIIEKYLGQELAHSLKTAALNN